MSVLFQTGKLCLYRKSFNTSFCKYIFLRKASGVPRAFTTFDEVVSQRRAEARRSLVIQVNSESSFNELFGYCSKYAAIHDIHHYKNAGGEHFMLIEFSTEENLRDVLQNCSSHQKDLDVMAVPSPFLWFRAAPSKVKYPTCNKNLVIKNGITKADEDVLFNELLNCDTVSDQIQLLYDRTILNDLGIRLRYMVARQLEMIFSSLYANIAIQPFGSSVNGFGRMGCDLDLVLTNLLTTEMTSPSRRLVYQEKKSEGGRSPWQRHMELVAALLELRAPGASRVQRILHARVPIVKYSHELTGLDCDLCYNNTLALVLQSPLIHAMTLLNGILASDHALDLFWYSPVVFRRAADNSGVYMSELLWLLGSLDRRVRPLTVLVRRWAAAVGLTSPHPGRWITNYPLTLMVLFFLQQRAMLPTVKHLVQGAGKEDVRIAEENLNCTFLRDMNKLPLDTFGQCGDNLETLLIQFFEYYAQFDFQEKAISINEGVPIRKPNAQPLYIINPLEQTLNVSRNVSYEELERLRLEVRNAAWQLEAGLEGKQGQDWGILGLLEKRASRELKKLLRVGNSHRLVSVKDLFNDKEGLSAQEKLELQPNTDVGGVKGTNDMIGKEAKVTQDFKFKNTQVRNEVNRIRRGKIL